MNNEPVAWMVDGVLFNSLGAALNISFDIEQPCIPLYTHPAKTEDEGKVCARCGAIAYDPVITQTAKTLTDEEIGDFTHRMVLCCQVHPNSADINVLGLKFIVEEILNKASER